MRKTKFIAIIISIILVSVVIIPIAINESYKYGVVYVTKWDAADVLSYYGTIIGASSTIVALVVTISFTRNQISRDGFLKNESEKWARIESTFAKILNEINSMVAHVQKFNQSHLSITMACCAPAPIWELEVLIKKLYPYANIFYEIIDQKELLQELRNGTYTFVLTPFKVKCPDTICYPYIKEDLYVSLPQQHHLKDKKEIPQKKKKNHHTLISDPDEETCPVHHNA